jgi:amino acid adenylation domain-containing protein
MTTSPNDVEAIYPLSPMQQGLLFHSLVSPHSGVYLLQFYCTLHGHFDEHLLEEAWQRVVARHAVLRTFFVLDHGDKPLQIVRKSADVPFDRQDWRDSPPQDQPARFLEFLRGDRAVGFDVAKAPLFRLTLVRTAADAYQLVWSVHHAIVDGWSISQVFREVFAAYESMRRGEEPVLPPVRPYVDYIAWLGAQPADEAERFWRRTLQGFESPTDLTSAANDERGAATEEGEDSQKLQLVVSSELTAALKALARRQQVTLNTVMQGAWALLLSRYTGEEDVVFGATVSGRPASLAGAESMVGLFINTLPVRIRVPRREITGDWLRGIQAQQAESRQYEYSSLADVQSWTDVPRGRALFDTLLLFESFPSLRSAVPDDGSLSVGEMNCFDATHYGVTLSVTPGDRMVLRFLYDRRVAGEGFIARLAERFEHLLASLAAGGERRVHELDLLGAAERDLVLHAWNDTASHAGSDCVHRLFEAQAWRETPAVIAADATLSYRELNARANTLARRLIAAGAGPGALVGICLERNAGIVVALLAVLKAGAAYVPLDPAYPVDRLAFMLEDARARVLVTERRLADGLRLSAPANVYLDEEQAAGEQPAGNPVVDVRPGDLAYVIYTSGSTGRPKGTQISHGALCNFLLSMKEAPGLGERDKLLAVTTLSFDIAGLELYLPLIAGASVVVAGRDAAASAPDLQALIERHAPTVMQATPATWRMLVENGWTGSKGMKLLCGGEAMSRDLAAALLARAESVWNMYGPTETTVWSTLHRVVDGSETVVPVGRPIANTQIYVLDTDLSPVPVGVPGELYIGGAGVARGYLDRPVLTAERFVPDPFGPAHGARLYRTGDLVRYRPDGSLLFLSRLDHQVKLRGFRIELGEIEAVLAQHDGVRQAVAVIREDAPGDQRLIAYVVGDPATMPGAGSLRAHAAAALPAYMVPAAFVVLDALPLTPNGKVDRKALPVPDGQRQVTDTFLAPRTDVEDRIARIWSEVLRVEQVGVRDNFFELGGHSLLLLRAHARIVQALGPGVSILDCFQHPTIESLVRHLGLGDAPAAATRARRRMSRRAAGDGTGAIAVVGMAGRFPGAADIEQFWRNLAAGVESIKTLTDAELAEAGVPEAVRDHPSYVKARGVLEDADLFDAGLFGYTPREAQLMDPQQRIFLECAWEALERASCDPATYDGLIGVYGGSSVNAYALSILARPDVRGELGAVGILLNTDKDYLATRVSYKLNLRGPSVNVQAACSTSLVAIHEACQSLLSHECDMALAGGVSVTVPFNVGYTYQDGGIVSPDGRCRAFDARARGTVGGSGVGVVVLKRLEDAIADGDTIRAVIRGSAINNDGSMKIGFTAPSAQGQAEVIAMAHAAAGIPAESIGYVEAHGTGTTLGDPIEVKALTDVFREETDKRQFCAIGSVKTNIGHLDAAAGVAGFIKAVLALEHRALPPSLHFDTPNPQIDFERSPFRVNTALVPWPAPAGAPRRAGVSSFGLGGTNAHVILEEAPPVEPSGPAREWQVMPVSARAAAALDEAAHRLARHLEEHPEIPLADVAVSLQTGRQALPHRRAVVCRDTSEAARALREPAGRNTIAGQVFAKSPSIVFMFPGQGTQAAGMGSDLYRNEPVFRETVDACSDLFLARLGVDVRDAIVAAAGGDARADALLARTSSTQAAIFTVELALAKLWMSWGITPSAMIGHSIGEYVAACLSGVLSLDDAARLVAVRGRLMDQAPAGRMLAVALPAAALEPMLTDGVWIAAVNAADQCVLSGAADRIAAMQDLLEARDVVCQPLRTSGAFHSGLMAPVMEPLSEAARSVKPGRIGIPYVSNVTGTWIQDADLEASYWARHVRSAVKFADGIDTLLKGAPVICIEVGPGQALSGLLRRHASASPDAVAIVSSLGHRGGRAADGETLARAVAQVWIAGVRPDWAAMHAPHRRRRVELPPYPFERKRHWLDARPSAQEPALRGPLVKRADVGSWLYVPSWRRSPGRRGPRVEDVSGRRFLVFSGNSGLGDRVCRELSSRGARVARAGSGGRFEEHGDNRFSVGARSTPDYERLFASLRRADLLPEVILHFWGLEPVRTSDTAEPAAFYDVLALMQAVAAQEFPHVDVTVVTSAVNEVVGGEAVDPLNAVALGPCRVMPLEHPCVACRHVDLATEEWEAPTVRAFDALLGELCARVTEPAVAWRRGHRWTLTYSPAPLDVPATPVAGVREGGVYLITGGTGGIGLEIAGHLARTTSARLVLTSRRGLPDRQEWPEYLRSHDESDSVARAIRAVDAMTKAGAEVLVLAADVADERRMREAVQETLRRFGTIDGVVHAAGIAGGGLIQLKTPDAAGRVLGPKIAGTLALSRALDALAPDFVVLCSSVTAVTGGVGQVDYCAANAFLDAFAYEQTRLGRPTISIGWDTWQEVGMAVDTQVPAHLARQRDEALKQGMTTREALDVLGRVLAGAVEPHVVVSTRDLEGRLAPLPSARGGAAAGAETPEETTQADTSQDRPELAEEYVGPRNEIEEGVAEVWQRLFGIVRIGVNDNFFDLGGHSLLATQLVSRLRAEFQIDLRLDTLFDAPTVGLLSDQILEKLLEQDQDAAGTLLDSVEALSDADIRSGNAAQAGHGSGSGGFE